MFGLPWWLRWWRIYLQCGRHGLDSWVGKIPWRRAWQPTPVFLPGESQWTVAHQAPLSMGFLGGAVVKNLPANTGNIDSIPDLGRSPGVGNGNPIQYSCLENSVDRRSWQTIVCGVAKRQTQLNMHAHIIIYPNIWYIWYICMFLFLYVSFDRKDH